MKSSEIVNAPAAIDEGEESKAAKSAEEALLTAMPVETSNAPQLLETTTTKAAPVAKPKTRGGRKNSKKSKNKKP
jgi:hypothetical protein